jgi:alpha-ketoglutarate-dependent taurine dioxygenase
VWSFSQLPIGVEVDVDLSCDFTPSDERIFRSLFFEHSLLLFRSQSLTPERQEQLCRLLGPVPAGASSEKGAVHQIALDGALGSSELVFHSDFLFDANPYVGVSLHALDVAPEGIPRTDFVSGAAAWTSLPDNLKSLVAGRSARNVFPLRTDVRSGDRPSDDYPNAVHPVVWRHPESGRETLLVSQQTTTEIVGLPRFQSEACLEQLFNHLYEPSAIYSHRWHTGDAVFWDNRALQHARPDQTGVERRTMQRVIIGHGTVGEVYGDFLASHREELAHVAHSATNVKAELS